MFTITNMLSKLNKYKYSYNEPRNIDKLYSSIKLYSEQDQIAFFEDIIYIIKSSDLYKLADMDLKDICLFVIDDYKSDLELVNNMEIVCFSKITNAQRLLNDSIKAINFYENTTKAQKAIIDALVNNRSVEHILEVASSFIKNPIILFNLSTNILAVSCKDVLISHGDEAIKENFAKGYNSYDIYQQYNISKIVNAVEKSKTPYVHTRPGENIKRLLMRILVDGKMVAFLNIQELVKEADEVDFFVMEFLAQVLSIKLQLIPNKIFFNDEPIENILMELIEDKFNSIEVFVERAKPYNWNLDKNFFILTITRRYNNENNLNDTNLLALKRYLDELLPYFKSVYYNGMLTMLIDLYDKISIPDTIEKTIVNFLKDNSLVAGLSCYFTNILDFSKYYKQTTNLIQMGIRLKNKDFLYKYEDFYFINILTNLEKVRDLKEFCIPQIYKLMEYDKINNSDLFHTLVVYLENSKNISESSSYLYIHKNTLRYRLSKISEILQMDIESGSDFVKLYMSIQIIKILQVD